MKNYRILAASLAAALALSACGGGGGGSSAPPLLVPAANFLADGINLTIGNLIATQTFDAFSIIARRETSGAVDFRFNEDNQTKITFRPRAGDPNNDFQIRLQVSQVSNDTALDITFDTRQTNPDLFVRIPLGNLDVLSFNERTIGPNTRLVIANPNGSQRSFSYQTFGFWENVNTTAANRVGGFSIGVFATPGDVLLLRTGSATYNGSMLGEVKTTGNPSETGTPISANVNVNVNFLARTADLTTSDSLVRTTTGSFVPDNSWNVAGTLNWSLGNNKLQGAISGPGGLIGEARARFYGPNAEELGGVLQARTGTRELSAGFGTER